MTESLWRLKRGSNHLINGGEKLSSQHCKEEVCARSVSNPCGAATNTVGVLWDSDMFTKGSDQQFSRHESKDNRQDATARMQTRNEGVKVGGVGPGDLYI